MSTRNRFAKEASLAALRWFVAGYGFDVTSLDVIEAFDHGQRAAKRIGEHASFTARVRTVLAAADDFVRRSLRTRITV